MDKTLESLNFYEIYLYNQTGGTNQTTLIGYNLGHVTDSKITCTLDSLISLKDLWGVSLLPPPIP